MHEMGIASSVLDAVRVELERRPGARLTKICLRVGELSGVEPDSLSFCFEAMVKDTEFERVILEIESAQGDELDFKYLELEE